MEEDLKEYLCLGFAGDLKVLLVRSAQLYRGGAFLKAGGETQVSGCPGVGAVPALVAGPSCRCKERRQHLQNPPWSITWYICALPLSLA